LSENPGAIAIVGMAGRFPGANDTEQFWKNLVGGVESITRFGPDELDVQPDPSSPDATDVYVAAKGVLDDVDKFDARFFGYIPREAALMDPQHRVFLETSHAALEDAACDPKRFDGQIGVYAGCYIDTYLLANLCSDREFLRRLIESIQVGTLQCELGNDKDYLATRVAFKLDLRGPAVTIQTACSTSLVAISHACLGLQTYQCDAAIAGGVTITFPMRKGYFHKKGGMLSNDGHCRAFDEKAQGTVFSNASAAVVLKRLDDAIAQGDRIYAVIRGHACNNDGAQKVSYTAPSVEGQAEVVALAQAVAGIDARSIDYVEAHGTATPIGDPIEVEGLTRAFRETTDEVGFCALGSVKTNIGHLDCASGVVGVIKTALALFHRKIPASLHFDRPNPSIDFSRTPFFVNAELRDWPEKTGPRRAGVSSFGVGGTNAHLVLEEAPTPSPRTSRSRDLELLVMSAKTEAALEVHAGRLARFLGDHPDVPIADVAYTLQRGREVHGCRRIVVARSTDEAIEKLQAPPSAADRSKDEGSQTPIVLLFPGQGSQFPGMAREIYDAEPVFAAEFDRCAAAVLPTLQRDLREILFRFDDEEGAALALKDTQIAQPAIFSIEYALARLWLSWGLRPDAMIGHSVGELAAACLSDIMSLENALELVVIRGRLMQSMPRGGMLSVRASAEQTAGLLVDGLDLAAVNAPELCVVSGAHDQIALLRSRLETEDIPHSDLHTSHAFHSAMMEDAVQPTIEAASRIAMRQPRIPIISTVTRSWAREATLASPEYWGRNLRETVQFAEAVSLAAEALPGCVFLEVGPGQTLSTLARQSLGQRSPSKAFSSLGHASLKGADLGSLVTAAGRLWLSGVHLDWEAFSGGAGRPTGLPSYPFERKRHWVEPTRWESDSEPIDHREFVGHATQRAIESAGRLPSEAGTSLGAEPLRTGALISQQLEVISDQLAVLRGRVK